MLEFGCDNENITQNCQDVPFVVSVSDTLDNELIVVIALSKRGEKGEGSDETDVPGLESLLQKAYPVYEDTENVYEIRFESYIIYQCRNESYTYMDDTEIRKGKYLILFEKSKFLEYYKSVITDVDIGDWKKDRKHYGIYTANHIIDVIANKPPVITRVNGVSVWNKTK